MSDWSHSSYEGEYKEGWYHGQGTFKYPNGVIYEGGFFKGEFHGEGTLIYPNGGKYKAKWIRGRMIEGDYFFDDELKYEFDNWDYCTEDKDRRFYYERQTVTGFDPKRYQNKLKPIPEGTYDVGDGYYDPVASIVYDYTGQVLRTPSEKEVEWIVSKCRYNPRTKLGELKGENDRVIKKAIEISREPAPVHKKEEHKHETVLRHEELVESKEHVENIQAHDEVVERNDEDEFTPEQEEIDQNKPGMVSSTWMPKKSEV